MSDLREARSRDHKTMKEYPSILQAWLDKVKARYTSDEAARIALS